MKKHDEIIEDYLREVIVKKSPESDKCQEAGTLLYLAHAAVINNESETTEPRASSKIKNDLSLNYSLLPTPYFLLLP